MPLQRPEKNALRFLLECEPGKIVVNKKVLPMVAALCWIASIRKLQRECRFRVVLSHSKCQQPQAAPN